VSGGRVVEVETYGVLEHTIAAVGTVPGIRSVAVEERGHQQVLIIQCERDAEVTQGVLALLGDVRVGRVGARQPTLEDAYVELVTGS
jgi:ABC-2 type transport system ATP-binding protein